MTEALRVEAGAIEDRLAVLRSRRERTGAVIDHTFDGPEQDRLSLAHDALTDEIATLEDQLEDVEDKIAAIVAREDRRDYFGSVL